MSNVPKHFNGLTDVGEQQSVVAQAPIPQEMFKRRIVGDFSNLNPATVKRVALKMMNQKAQKKLARRHTKILSQKAMAMVLGCAMGATSPVFANQDDNSNGHPEGFTPKVSNDLKYSGPLDVNLDEPPVHKDESPEFVINDDAIERMRARSKNKNSRRDAKSYVLNREAFEASSSVPPSAARALVPKLDSESVSQEEQTGVKKNYSSRRAVNRFAVDESESPVQRAQRKAKQRKTRRILHDKGDQFMWGLMDNVLTAVPTVMAGSVVLYGALYVAYETTFIPDSAKVISSLRNGLSFELPSLDSVFNTKAEGVSRMTVNSIGAQGGEYSKSGGNYVLPAAQPKSP